METERRIFWARIEERTSDSDLLRKADDAIMAGLASGQALVRRRRRKFQKRFLAFAAASCFLIVCFASIRVSPAFASAIRQIPGMEALVEAIRHDYPSDDTLQDAIDNGYLQKVDVSDEHDGLKFTVEGIVADKARMVLVYTLEGLAPGEQMSVQDIDWKDGSGRKLGLSYGTAGYVQGTEEARSQTDSIEILFPEREPLPDVMGMSVKLRNATYAVTFPIDKKLFAGNERTIPLDETIEVDGQRIVIEKARISPLRIAIEGYCEESNTKAIFGAGDMLIVDDAGKEWGLPSFSMGAAEKNEAHFEFKSSYFRNPKKLYLTGSWFRAVDKGKLLLVVDTDKKSIVQAPDGQVAVADVSTSFGKTFVTFKLNLSRKDDNMGYMLLAGPFVDAAGKKGTATAMGTSMGFAGGEYMHEEDRYELSSGDYVQPLTFDVYMYPQYIEKPYRIEIPLDQ
ncbi:DUF4179 domain-containing protein [Cohnella hashimotonis]|uniref:DUF4179 domain-containing protein n=1 Tax=Cohnella hashimotonis TaxID=2826895 RepID=A0ABT6TH39_9BACL|nr:DUF4179 domain-containing protein [Cohnella hashimotonis]MDI4646158.1 DUF4179 domain-containing protein [Cohnella hashimotonis]